jgi:hypothetical protein
MATLSPWILKKRVSLMGSGLETTPPVLMADITREKILLGVMERIREGFTIVIE